MKRSDNGHNRWSSSGDEKQLSLLVISPFPDDAAQVCKMLGESIWSVLSAWSLQQALALLNDNPVALVICERDLPDGCWRDLLYVPSQPGQVPVLIVTSRVADERLWAEVLNEGEFDVIPKPLCGRDVTWVLASASRQHQQQYLRARHAEA
jgi:DNA-binding response OmpR family regulator